YSAGYRPGETTVVSFGTGRFIRKQDPHLITGWLSWVLDTLLHAPEEQQTEIVARHYSQSVLFRLEPDLPANIDMDDIGSIPELEELGEQFAARVDWDAILSGRETEFRVIP